jgi:hypothetical protein
LCAAAPTRKHLLLRVHAELVAFCGDRLEF